MWEASLNYKLQTTNLPLMEFSSFLHPINKLLKMTSNEILKSDDLDILFEKRNKEYGAYTLRRNYNQRLGLALAIGIGAFLLLLFLCQTHRSISQANHVDPDVIVTTVVVPPPPQAPLPPAPARLRPAQASVAQKMLTSINIVPKDVPAVNDMPLIKDMI